MAHSKKRPVIGLDLDGVVYDFQGTYKYLLETHRDVRFPGEVDRWWTTWNSPDEHTSQEDRDWVWSKGVKLGLFRHGHVVKGAIDGVRELSKLGDVHVVTHRPERAVRDTLAFLVYQDLPITGVTVTQGPKSEVGCDVYIDDGPHVVEELLTAGRSVVVFDRPYNRPEALGMTDFDNPDPLGMYSRRALNWREVPPMVKELLG